MFTEFKAELRGDPIESLTRTLLADRCDQLRQLRGALDAYEARLVCATNRLGDSGIDGAAMLRSAGRVSSRTAARSAKRAESLEQLPNTRSALGDGRITAEHVDSIVAAAEKVTPKQADDDLLAAAAASPADVFEKAAGEWAAKNRVDDGSDEVARQRRDRTGYKWIKKRSGMRAFYCELDRVEGDAAHASLEKRYEELWRDDGGREGTPNDVRTPHQRMADAFVSLITDPGTDRCTGAAPSPKHHLNAVYDIAGKTNGSGHPLASLITDGEPLPTDVVERIACDAAVTPMIFNGPGQPIWVGRSRRSASSAQWKALVVRDRCCVGCGAGSSRCEAHHIVTWQAGGSTDITNLVLVCSRCHHDLHDRNMALRRTDGRWHISNRDGPVPYPRGPGVKS